MDTILDFIKSAFQYIKNLIVKVINRCLNFFNDIVNWFKKIPLIKGKQTPFIAPPETIRKLIKNAPIKNVGIFEESKVGIFKGVYDEETNEITHHEYIKADALDEQTKGYLGKEDLVVLN